MWYELGGQYYQTDPETAQQWGATLVPSYQSASGETYQFAPGLIGKEGYQAPEARMYSGSTLLQVLDELAGGPPSEWAQGQWAQLQPQLQVPSRDWRTLIAPGGAYDASQRQQYPAVYDPDYLSLLQQVHQAAQQGDPQAQALLPTLRKEQDRATYESTAKR